MPLPLNRRIAGPLIGVFILVDFLNLEQAMRGTLCVLDLNVLLKMLHRAFLLVLLAIRIERKLSRLVFQRLFSMRRFPPERQSEPRLIRRPPWKSSPHHRRTRIDRVPHKRSLDHRTSPAIPPEENKAAIPTIRAIESILYSSFCPALIAGCLDVPFNSQLASA
jgi:hypothetical protein